MSTKPDPFNIDGYNAGQQFSATDHSNTNRTTRALASAVTFVDQTGHGGTEAQRGDAVLLGEIKGVVENNVEANTEMHVINKSGKHVLTCNGANNAGNIAINVGDVIYFDAAVPELNKDATNGVRFGVASGPGTGEIIASGASGLVIVDLDL